MVTHDTEIAARFPRVINCRDFAAGGAPMKNVLFLALRYLRFNKIKTAIMVFSVAVAVFLPLAVNLLVRDYQRGPAGARQSDAIDRRRARQPA